MYALADVIWLVIDKVTDRIASYIKFKELEKRVKIDD